MARMNEGKETWHRLLEWDRGQAPAERLAAVLLHNDGFKNIDPSHPLGGKDDKKDIVFIEKDSKWIAGVYFPRGQQSFTNIKKKFLDDFSGVAANYASGFVFFTNQELRLAERQELCDMDITVDIVIYHLERIATMLNTPINYGVRLEFLDIEMTKEEQLSFFAGISASPNAQMKPELSLRGVLESKPSPDAYSHRKYLTDSEFMKNKEKEIGEIRERVTSILMPDKCIAEPLEVQNSEQYDNDAVLLKYLPNEEITTFKDKINKINFSELFTVKDAEIEPERQKIIIDYLVKQGVPVTDNFFFLGNLRATISKIRLPFSNSEPSLQGTDEEKEKYNLLIELYWKIAEYNEYFGYFSALQEKHYVKCIISNTGTSYDEDIDVKLIFPKGYICNAKKMPSPGYSFIEEFNASSIEETLFTMEALIDVDRFSNYPSVAAYSPDIDMTLLMYGKSASEEYEIYKDAYNDALDRLFCYTTFSDEKHEVLSFKIPYLKQNKNMCLPTVLIFEQLPQEIEYEIRSKHLSDVIRGALKVIKDK